MLEQGRTQGKVCQLVAVHQRAARLVLNSSLCPLELQHVPPMGCPALSIRNALSSLPQDQVTKEVHKDRDDTMCCCPLTQWDTNAAPLPALASSVIPQIDIHTEVQRIHH